MSKLEAGKPFYVGANNNLEALLTLPRGEAVPTGMIIWGLGVAELQAARQLSRKGITSLQIRVNIPREGDKNERDFLERDILNESGVSKAQEAMDFLSNELSLTQFALMGNCAPANVSFNTALTDKRVTGLILTNLHFSESLTYGIKFKKSLFKASSWKRALSGKSNYGRMASTLINKIRSSDTASLIAEEDSKKDIYRGDLLIADDFVDKLETLVEREVETLIAFAQGEPGLSYIRQIDGEKFSSLMQSEHLRVEDMPTDAHIFSTDDAAAVALNSVISDWSQRLVIDQQNSASESNRVV